MYSSSHNNIDSLHIYEEWCRLMHVSIISCTLDAYAKYYIILTSYLILITWPRWDVETLLDLAVNLTGHWKGISYVCKIFVLWLKCMFTPLFFSFLSWPDWVAFKELGTTTVVMTTDNASIQCDCCWFKAFITKRPKCCICKLSNVIQ